MIACICGEDFRTESGYQEHLDWNLAKGHTFHGPVPVQNARPALAPRILAGAGLLASLALLFGFGQAAGGIMLVANLVVLSGRVK